MVVAMLLLHSNCHGNRLLELKTAEEYMNVCMDGILHKLTPGPESELFKQCSPWSKRSCCTKEIAEQMHANATWYKMDWSHCQQKLSKTCRGKFMQDLCFYECSPNVGPWLVKVDGMKIRKERFVDVPLCRQECDAWWDACKDDYTCIENWARGFDWSTGFPKCPEGTSCKPMRQVYTNASHFCETVWDHSWKVVNNDDPNGCMVMWWNEGEANPNRNIAYRRAQQIVSSSSRISVFCYLYFLSFLLVSVFQTLLIV